MTDIVLSHRARDDFKRIWRYIALDNEDAADRLLLALDAKIERLRTYPVIGGLRNQIRQGARALVHGSTLVLYEFRPADDTVEIIAVVEGMRDLGLRQSLQLSDLQAKRSAQSGCRLNAAAT